MHGEKTADTDPVRLMHAGRRRTGQEGAGRKDRQYEGSGGRVGRSVGGWPEEGWGAGEKVGGGGDEGAQGRRHARRRKSGTVGKARAQERGRWPEVRALLRRGHLCSCDASSPENAASGRGAPFFSRDNGGLYEVGPCRRGRRCCGLHVRAVPKAGTGHKDAGDTGEPEMGGGAMRGADGARGRGGGRPQGGGGRRKNGAGRPLFQPLQDLP